MVRFGLCGSAGIRYLLILPTALQETITYMYSCEHIRRVFLVNPVRILLL